MKQVKNTIRCAIYTRKSHEEGLDQDFNSLHAQREACEAYILSQKHEGWEVIKSHYNDGGFSGGNIDRPGLRALMTDIGDGLVDVVVVYKVDRLTRALADFAKIVEQFDAQEVSFMSVTQQFNTTTSMGRLTLNVLLSFAQFEREVTGERIRDKIAASKKKGMWMGGPLPLGYEVKDRKLIINEEEAAEVRFIFETYTKVKSVFELTKIVNKKGMRTKKRTMKDGRKWGGKEYMRPVLYGMLNNPIFNGKIVHKENVYDGEHDAVIDDALWQKVQDTLKENAAERHNGVRSKRPSLLAGKVYDENGNYMSPRHGLKNDKRYRYYISRAIINGNEKLKPKVGNIPAYEIEEVTTQIVLKFLADKNKLMELSASIDEQEAVIVRAELLLEKWESLTLQEQFSVVRNMVARVVLHEYKVEIFLGKNAVRTVLNALANDNLTNLHLRPGKETAWIGMETETRITRFKHETKLIIAPSFEHESAPANPTLLRALSRAFVWNEMLMTGKVISIGDIAQMEGLDARYVKRIWQLAFLPTKTMQQIMNGQYHQPLESLLKN
jgi:site-specific DNA recombinase